MATTRRLDLKVGYSCNMMCRHCAQGGKRFRFKDKTAAEIKSELVSAFNEGIRSVVFTGGEPTIRKDIVELVAFAKEQGYELIQVQTNGRRFASRKFTDAMIEAGMNEFSPALNGHIPALHDFLSQVPGAWKQTVAGIKNVREYEIPIISNTVISRPNYRFARNISQLLVSLGVDQYQLAFVHPVGSAWTNFWGVVPRMSLAAPYVHRGLQVGLDAGLKVMAEAMPFCMMKGYELQVSELYIPSTTVYEKRGNVESFEEWRVHEGKWKGEQCRDCVFKDICEGPWREYVWKYGGDEFIPVKSFPEIQELKRIYTPSA